MDAITALLGAGQRGFITVSDERKAAADALVASVLANATKPITEAGFSGNYVSPGGDYTGTFYPVELVDIAPGAWDLISEADAHAMLDWLFSHQLDGTGTYTPNGGGGPLSYPAGAVPDYVPANGAMGSLSTVPNPFVTQGDRLVTTNVYGNAYIAWLWGYKRGWDATWLSWWAANSTKVEAAFNSNLYDGATKLVAQHAGSYRSGGLFVLTEWDGLQITESVMAHNSARALAGMHERAGNSSAAATWTALADEIQASIQAQFIVDADPLWDVQFENFSWFARATYGTGNLPQPTGGAGAGQYGWAEVTSGSGYSYVIAAHPTNASANILRVASGSSYAYLQRMIPTRGADAYAPYSGNPDRIRVRSRQTAGSGGAALRYVHDTGGGDAVFVSFDASGHLRYYNGSVFVNLPTDTTWSASTWYTMEARLNWGANQATIYVDGVSKGTIAILNTGSSAQKGFLFGADNSGATVEYEYARAGNVPTDSPGTVGYLPWSSGPRGLIASPMATAYAVYSGILTSTQRDQAARWFMLHYDQPEILSGGRGNLFSRIPKAHGLTRWIRWSDDIAPNKQSTYPIAPGVDDTYTANYGFFINGGYLNWGLHWVIYALHLAAPEKAQALVETMIDEIDASYPYEKANGDDATVQGALYLQGATSIQAVIARGLDTLTGAFTYVPVATSVTPPLGTAAGGTAVTITGVGLTGATGATFGGLAATSFVVVDDTTITAITPAHAAGAVDVVVTVGGIYGTLAGGFAYIAPPTPTARQFSARQVVIGSTDYGLDVSTIRGLDPTFTLIGERRAIAEVYARMLQTPRGSLFYAPSRGTDVRAWLNARVKDAGTLARWRHEVEAEGERDERIESASATLTWNQQTGALRIAVAVESAAGPFTMVLAATALTLNILEVQ